MILVDTSVWIDHLHQPDERLNALLSHESALSHPLVLAELALGSLKHRSQVLDRVARMPRARRAPDDALRHFIDSHRLWSKGLNAVDASLLASALITPDTRLWTRDRRLASVAAELGAGWSPS